MDAFLAVTSALTSTTFPTWDLELDSSGCLVTVTGTAEKKQKALIAGWQQLGTIPELLTVGVDWVGYLTGSITLATLLAQVNANLKLAQVTDYTPTFDYNSENGLVLTMEEV
jgi:hypothetical protein